MAAVRLKASGLAGWGLLSLWVFVGGCAWSSRFGTDARGSEYGRTYYIGGAGPIGNVVGASSVPEGLRKGKYRGSIEVFAWQSMVGGTLRDQMDRSRNEHQARRLAQRIRDYLERYPGRRVNIIALSAGTGIATWALESLEPQYRLGTVVFLGSSLSRQYDLSAALSRIDGHLYCFFSTRDPLLRYGLPITGSVDRKFALDDAAGLYGFILPPEADESVLRLYRQRLRNRPYKSEYRRYGYYGLHADSTHPDFIARVITPLLSEKLEAVPSSQEDLPVGPGRQALPGGGQSSGRFAR